MAVRMLVALWTVWEVLWSRLQDLQHVKARTWHTTRNQVPSAQLAASAEGLLHARLAPGKALRAAGRHAALGRSLGINATRCEEFTTEAFQSPYET